MSLREPREPKHHFYTIDLHIHFKVCPLVGHTDGDGKFHVPDTRIFRMAFSTLPLAGIAVASVAAHPASALTKPSDHRHPSRARAHDVALAQERWELEGHAWTRMATEMAPRARAPLIFPVENMVRGARNPIQTRGLVDEPSPRSRRVIGPSCQLSPGRGRAQADVPVDCVLF